MDQQGGRSDAELVGRALSATTPEQRKTAFADIADRHHLTVFRQCARWFPHPEEAQDVGQATFEAAFALLAAGRGPAQPTKLAGWLIEIARRRGQEYRRKDRPAGLSWADLPEGQSLDQFEDDTEPRSGSGVRRAHANRLVETVVATLTARQQQVYELRIVQELSGRQVAERLGVADKTASNEITQIQNLLANGFGALILFQEGRRYCPGLALIIETVPAVADGADFSAALRERIVRHFDKCNVCDDCRTCSAKRRELVGPYVPALVPVLFGAEFRDRISQIIDGITGPSGHPPASHPGSGTSAGAGQGLATGTGLAASETASPTGSRLGRAVRRRPVVSATIAVVVLAAAGGGTAAALTGSGGSGGGVATTKAAASSGPGVTTVDIEGAAVNAKVLAVAREVLADARAHDSGALDQLLATGSSSSESVAALNNALAQPGTYGQIITLLTKTHSVSQSADTEWPGFLLAGTSIGFGAADAKTLGVTSAQQYTGITVAIGGVLFQTPFTPKLTSIADNAP